MSTAAANLHFLTASSGGGILPETNREDVVLEGPGLQAGYAIAPACVITISMDRVPSTTITIDRCEAEVQRVRDAARLVAGQFECLIQVHCDTGHAQQAMADSFRLISADNILMPKIEEHIRVDRWSATYAVQQVFDAYFESVDTSFTHDRAHEAEDIKNRLIAVLDPTAPDTVEQLRKQIAAMPGPKIVVTRDLSPAEAIQLENHDVVGIVILNAGHLGHQGMILQDLDCPVVGGIDLISQGLIRQGEELVVDGDHGIVTLHPSAAVRQRARDMMTTLDTPGDHTPISADGARTRDGVGIEILGDLKNPRKINELRRLNVRHMGLVRTEFALLRANTWPTEGDQIHEFKLILKESFPESVSLRTFDLGSDKVSAGLGCDEAMTSGLRGIRYALAICPGEFHKQLRAMVQAAVAVGNPTRIIFPMVLDVGDMKRAKAVYEKVLSELTVEGKITERPKNISLGAMIETSSAVELIDSILKHSDFVSVGTRDLLISTLDGDLNKAQGAHYHPAFLSCMRRVIEAAKRAEKELFVCGEMPCHTRNIPLLVGLGARRIVVSSQMIEEVNAKLAKCDSKQCEHLVQRMIETGDGEEAYDILVKFLEELRDT